MSLRLLASPRRPSRAVRPCSAAGKGAAPERPLQAPRRMIPTLLPVHRLRLLLPLLALLALALAAPAAQAATPEEIIEDCSYDGDLDRKYSPADLQRAQDELPSDRAEYGYCAEVIAAAIENPGARAGNGDPNAGPGDPRALGSNFDGAPPTPQDLADLDGARREGRHAKNAPVIDVDDQEVSPGGRGILRTATATNDLPLPLLLVVLAAVLMFAAGAGGIARRGIAGAPGVARRILRR